MSHFHEICRKLTFENAYYLDYNKVNPDTIVQVSLHSYLIFSTEWNRWYFFVRRYKAKKCSKPSMVGSKGNKCI